MSIQEDGTPIADRQDRLLRLLSSDSVESQQLKQIADESARYNMGPISRNFNVPTMVLFFFDRETIGRFRFERKGIREIDGLRTWEVEFKETARPALVRTREGRDVPSNGRLWVVPTDGTVLRTRIELQDFADEQYYNDLYRRVKLRSVATIEVAYRLDRRFATWLPWKMSETYEAPVPVTGAREPSVGRATGVAEYSNFRRFETSATILAPK